MSKLSVGRFIGATARGFLWLIVLIPILAVSGYSLFYVARYLGVPPVFAVVMSTCFDGTLLIAAEYSLRYAQVGLSGSGPRTVVRVGAVLAAYLQTLHARIGHEPRGAWVLWAALPVAAVVVYDIHIRWERRKALASAGVVYPAPLPAFGFGTWILFPFATLTALRTIVGRRKDAVTDNTLKRMPTAVVTAPRVVTKQPKPIVAESAPAPALTAPAGPVVTEPANGNDRETEQAEILSMHDEIKRMRSEELKERGINPHTPTKHIRAWARSTGRYPGLGDRARMPKHIVADYNAEHGITDDDEERSS